MRALPPVVVSGLPNMTPIFMRIWLMTRVKVVKNKVAPPFREAEFEILYGEGISREGELIELGVKHNLIEKTGSWYSYQGDRIGQGKENVRQYLKDHPEIVQQLDQTLRNLLLMGKARAAESLEPGLAAE